MVLRQVIIIYFFSKVSRFDLSSHWQNYFYFFLDANRFLIVIGNEKQTKTRVSGVMTNAPFIVNLDCDMFVNNPNVVVEAMCVLLGSEEHESVFVQFPQMFYNQPKDDPFGSQLNTLFQVSWSPSFNIRFKISHSFYYCYYILWVFGRHCYVGWQESKALFMVDVIASIDVKLSIPWIVLKIKKVHRFQSYKFTYINILIISKFE